MKHSFYVGLFSVVIASSASAVEWEEKEWFSGASLGYANITTDGYDAAPIYSFNVGLTVPLVVEHHLRASPQLQFNYIAVEPDKEKDAKGGNFYSGSAGLYLERNVSFGDRPMWLGIAPMISGSYISDAYQWQSTSNGLRVVELDSSFSFAIDFAVRLNIPLTDSLSTALVGQYSPLDGSFNGALFNLSLKF